MAEVKMLVAPSAAGESNNQISPILLESKMTSHFGK
jgi:hypothetical protein